MFIFSLLLLVLWGERYVSPELKYIPDDLRDQEGYWTSVYRSATFPRAPTWIPTHWSYSKGFSASSSSKICRIFPRWSDYITIRWG
jgi:hypothetical protein